MAQEPDERTRVTKVVQRSHQEEALLLTSGPGSPKTFPLTSDVILGRSPEADVVLNDTAVSRKHASIKRSGDEWELTDLGSSNGLLLNGTKIRAATLQNSDYFQLGPFVLQVRLPPTPVRQSAFISYGGPDEQFGLRLNHALTRDGVKTFLFKEHALPGQRIDRVMREGVNEYDRMILVCSEASLERPGVIAELTEILARESRDGGAEYLIPIRIDDYLFTRWQPARPDLKRAIIDRVVADFSDPASFEDQVDKLVRVLRGRRFGISNIKPEPVSIPLPVPSTPEAFPEESMDQKTSPGIYALIDEPSGIPVDLERAAIRARQMLPTIPHERVTQILVDEGMQRDLAKAAVLDAMRNYRRRG
jgi:hypothetical protein